MAAERPNMRRRRFLFLMGAGALLPLTTTAARPKCPTVTLLNAMLELGGTWRGSAPADAIVVIEHVRSACLSGVALLSDRQPEKLRVDDKAGIAPSVWLHTDFPATAWVIVIVGKRDWCNLAYQFGHELGHVLCNSWQPDANPRDPCQWIEEALVEAFSLRGLGLMANDWAHAPPFPHDAAYAVAIREYRETILASYRTAARDQGADASFSTWFKTHEGSLHENKGLQAARGAVPAMFDLLQSDAAMIADMGAMNRWAGRSGVPIHDYLDLWERSCTELKAPNRLPVHLRDLLAGA
jgi:hypothetical protein